ncbi:hypothetical protein R8O05_21110 [Vibrio sp. 1865]|uniref:hypothetical protein n=1 Tax=unclassified Vibrio TaxID=2614977 RepID=UPI002963D995|nr:MULTISPECIES: hypothetical protein [unclassified Vibrio]MDW2094034.1 hypothetical protein [Vibrio sp. 1866]MDW3103805.1 hypothetical protein [Vibrio sp. 1874]MDW3201813.1 hypothetical protein [Vibrio sp. 1865]
MSITIYGTVLVPQSMSEADAQTLQREISERDEFKVIRVQRDVTRKVHFMFEGERTVESKGLEYPDVMFGAWCETGGDPFFYEPAYKPIAYFLKDRGYNVLSYPRER